MFHCRTTSTSTTPRTRRQYPHTYVLIAVLRVRPPDSAFSSPLNLRVYWPFVTAKAPCREASRCIRRSSSRSCLAVSRKADARPPGKGDPNSHGARPVHLIITTRKWIRTCRLSMKNSLSRAARGFRPGPRSTVSGFGCRRDLRIALGLADREKLVHRHHLHLRSTITQHFCSTMTHLCCSIAQLSICVVQLPMCVVQLLSICGVQLLICVVQLLSICGVQLLICVVQLLSIFVVHLLIWGVQSSTISIFVVQ